MKFVYLNRRFDTFLLFMSIAHVIHYFDLHAITTKFKFVFQEVPDRKQ